ncbi:MAG: hypothetical protein JXR63_11860 [Spirochaetales bacterium]|nr:hypothetical protein [Spirochaetales bacterium]
MAFLDDFLTKISGLFSPESGKPGKKELKQLAKSIKKNKYNFYRPRINEVDPNLAKFLYQIYRFTGPLHKPLERYDSSEAIKQLMVDRYLPEDVLEMKSTFSESSIRIMFQTNNSNIVMNQLKKNFAAFKKMIGKSGMQEINHNYRALLSFIALVKFDLYYVLKKFDPKLPELDFVYKTRFEPIIGQKIVDDMKDFLAIIYNIEPATDWAEIFTFINEYRGSDVIQDSGWKKILKSIEDIKKSRILEMMISLIDEDPNFTVKTFPAKENIVATYVDKEGNELQKNLKNIISEKKDSNINEFVKRIFGKIPPNRVKYYSDKLNEAILAKSETGFIYKGAINFLKSFFLDFLKKDIREVSNIYLIRGKWFSTVTSQNFSDCFHRLLELSDELMEFDNSLSEEFRRGAAIKAYTKLSERDKSGAAILERIVKEINEEAKQIVVESAQNLINLARILKTVIEDSKLKTHKYINNWKELEQAHKGDLVEDSMEVYRKIYDMVKLLQLYIAK